MLLPLLLVAGGIGALALVARSSSSSSSARSWGPDHLPTAADMPGAPPLVVALVQAMISKESDPAMFDKAAADVDPLYPSAAAILRSRAATLRGQQR